MTEPKETINSEEDDEATVIVPPRNFSVPVPPPPAEESSSDDDRTYIYSQPIFPAGFAAKPADKDRIMAHAGPDVQKQVQITGKEKFEYMLLYCLKLLAQAEGKICAFYMEDFGDVDEFSMRVLQQLIGRSGYVTSDFIDHGTNKYTGFWAWLKK
ncbi:MAG TPA: hypothetical protein VEK08_02875 [Planctomycetota bacterium]|nr:hypothetical protein [Planctomycetota bacterium]